VPLDLSRLLLTHGCFGFQLLDNIPQLQSPKWKVKERTNFKSNITQGTGLGVYMNRKFSLLGEVFCSLLQQEKQNKLKT